MKIRLFFECGEERVLQENDAYMLEVGTGQTARDIIKWAYSKNAEMDAVSPDVYIYQIRSITTTLNT